MKKITGRILAPAAFAIMLGYAGYSVYNQHFRDAPERLEGFGSYLESGYVLKEADMPTKGDVVLVRRLPEGKYMEKENPDGTLTISGRFYYRIRPALRFSPNTDYHTDSKGNAPWDSGDYWGAIRPGSVTLEKRAAEAE